MISIKEASVCIPECLLFLHMLPRRAGQKFSLSYPFPLNSLNLNLWNYNAETLLRGRPMKDLLEATILDIMTNSTNLDKQSHQDQLKVILLKKLFLIEDIF